MSEVLIPQAAEELLKELASEGSTYAARFLSIESDDAKSFWRRLIDIRSAAEGESRDRRFWLLLITTILFPLDASLEEKRRLRELQNKAGRQLKKVSETAALLACQLRELSDFHCNGASMPGWLDLFSLVDLTLSGYEIKREKSELPKKFGEWIDSFSPDDHMENPPLHVFVDCLSRAAKGEYDGIQYSATGAFKDIPFLASQKCTSRDYARQIRKGLSDLVGPLGISPDFVRGSRVDDRYSLFGEPQWLYLLNVIKGCHPPVTRDQLKDAFT